MPWKNGRGTTLEIFKIEDLFRISQAKISEDGTFSLFPGMDRWILVLEGEGIVLNGKTLKSFEPYKFSGDDQSHASLLKTEVQDFNVMVKRDWAEVVVEVKRVRHLNFEAREKTFIYQMTKGPELWILDPSDIKEFSFDQDTVLIMTYLTVK